MKKLLSLFLFLVSNVLVFSQEIFPNEKKVEILPSYSEIELIAKNNVENVSLEGVLITPSDTFTKIVCIIPGSGPETRHNHPVLAEAFLSNDIAVFRYDERGNGNSTGTYNDNTYTLTMLGKDIEALFNALKNIPTLHDKKIGLLGHSYGGMGIMEAIENGINPDFLIFIASPVQKNAAFFIHQLENNNPILKDKFIYNSMEEKVRVVETINREIGKNSHLPDNEIRKVAKKKSKQIGYNKKRYKKFGYYIPHYNFEMIKKDFEPTFKKLKVPVLYVVGENDKMVNAALETETLSSMGNINIEIKIYEGLGHFLQKDPVEYLNVYNIDKEPKLFISNWLKNLE